MTFVAGLGVGFVAGTGCCVATWLWAHLRNEGSIPWD